jgi:hypothetical protein
VIFAILVCQKARIPATIDFGFLCVLSVFRFTPFAIKPTCTINRIRAYVQHRSHDCCLSCTRASWLSAFHVSTITRKTESQIEGGLSGHTLSRPPAPDRDQRRNGGKRRFFSSERSCRRGRVSDARSHAAPPGPALHGLLHRRLLRREADAASAPPRVVAAVFCQTVGHRPENPTVRTWQGELGARLAPSTLLQPACPDLGGSDGFLSWLVRRSSAGLPKDASFDRVVVRWEFVGERSCGL